MADQLDVKALLLTGFDIKAENKPEPGQPDDEQIALKPVGHGGGGKGLSTAPSHRPFDAIFGQATSLADKVALVNQITHTGLPDVWFSLLT